MAEETKKAVKKEKVVYTKEQILASQGFCNRRDLAEAVLEKDTQYTLEEANKLVEKYLKGKVK